jgi:hypothetical protein
VNVERRKTCYVKLAALLEVGRTKIDVLEHL